MFGGSHPQSLVLVACLIGVAACGSVDGAAVVDEAADGATGSPVRPTTETTVLFSDLPGAAPPLSPSTRPLEVHLDPTGRPYDQPMPLGATVSTAPIGPVDLPGGDLVVNPGESLFWGLPEARLVHLGDDERYEVEAVLLTEGDAGQYVSVAGLVFHVSDAAVERWSPFEVAYGTDGGMGATTSTAFGPMHHDVAPAELEASATAWINRLSTEGGLVVEDADGVPGSETILFANGFGDGAFPMTRGYDAGGELARVVVWHLTVPWRVVFGDAPLPPDVADRESDLAACLAGEGAPSGYAGCVARA